MVVVPCARWKRIGAQRLLGIAAGEGRTGAAVDVLVDEARHEHGVVAEIAPIAARGRRAVPDGGDAVAVDGDPPGCRLPGGHDGAGGEQGRVTGFP